MKAKLRLGAAAIAVVAFSGAAAAQAPVSDILYGAPGADLWQHNGFYAGIGFRYALLQVPRIGGATQSRPTPLTLNATSAGDFFEPGKVSHFGPEGRLGYAFADGTFPAWLGMNVRAELGGYFVKSPDATDRVNTASSNGFSLSSVNGQFAAGGFGVPGTATSTHRFDANQFRIGLKGKTDFRIGENWLLTPSLGLYGGQSTVSHRLHENVGFAGFPNAINYDLDARLRWRDIGGTLGIDISYKATPWLLFYVGGRLALAHRHATLAANDRQSNSTIGNPNFASSLNASRDVFAFMGGGEGGVIFGAGGPWIISLSGGVEYDNKIPRFVTQSNNGSGATACPCTPASLSFRTGLNFNAAARLTVRLN